MGFEAGRNCQTVQRQGKIIPDGGIREEQAAAEFLSFDVCHRQASTSRLPQSKVLVCSNGYEDIGCTVCYSYNQCKLKLAKKGCCSPPFAYIRQIVSVWSCVQLVVTESCSNPTGTPQKWSCWCWKQISTVKS